MQFDFDFYDLINDNSTDFIAEIPSEGYYDEAGDWVTGEPVRYKLRGAIVSRKESKIFQSGGAITGQDRALYMLEPLVDALQLAKIYHAGRMYSIGEQLINGEITGVYAYILKFVSAFKDKPADFDITEDVDKLEDRLDGVLSEKEEEPKVYDLTENSKTLEKRLDGVDYD